jgi:hypothetical protein
MRVERPVHWLFSTNPLLHRFQGKRIYLRGTSTGSAFFWNISTLRKHDLPVLEYLRRALDGRPFPPQAAKTA